MDFGLVFLSAVVGGVLGGAGGLIGWLVGKRFPSGSKLVVQACTTVGVIIALAITPAIQRAMFGKAGLATTASANDVKADYDRQFRSDPLFGKIAEGWPSEYKVFLDDIVSRHGRIDDAEAQQLGFDFTLGLRRAQASNAFLAGDPGLREYFSGYRDLLRDINAEGGEALCNGMVLNGPVALRGREERYTKQVQRIGVITMDLLLEGRRHRDAGAAPIDPPSQEALDAFEAYLVERTGEQNLLERMRRGEGPNPCSNALNVMSALAEFAPDDVHGRAVRISIFHETAAR
jgi:hypothetical protein